MARYNRYRRNPPRRRKIIELWEEPEKRVAKKGVIAKARELYQKCDSRIKNRKGLSCKLLGIIVGEELGRPPISEPTILRWKRAGLLGAEPDCGLTLEQKMAQQLIQNCDERIMNRGPGPKGINSRLLGIVVGNELGIAPIKAETIRIWRKGQRGHPGILGKEPECEWMTPIQTSIKNIILNPPTNILYNGKLSVTRIKEIIDRKFGTNISILEISNFIRRHLKDLAHRPSPIKKRCNRYRYNPPRRRRMIEVWEEPQELSAEEKRLIARRIYEETGCNMNETMRQLRAAGMGTRRKTLKEWVTDIKCHEPKQSLEKDVIQFLGQKGGCANSQEFADLWGLGSKPGAISRLKPLVKNGVIEQRGGGRKRTPAKYCLPGVLTFEESVTRYLEKRGGCATSQDFADYWKDVTSAGASKRLRRLVRKGIVEQRGWGVTAKYCLPDAITLEEKIAQFVTQKGGCVTIQDFADYFNQTTDSVRGKVRELYEKGVIEKRGQSKRTIYCLPHVMTLEEDAIHFLDKKNGCATATDFATHWNLGRRVAQERLKPLVKKEIIEMRGEGGYTKYCLPGVSEYSLEEDVIEFLIKKGGCATINEFNDCWNLTVEGVRRRLKKVREKGLITKAGRSINTRYCLSDKIVEADWIS